MTTRSERYFREEVFPWIFQLVFQFQAFVIFCMKSIFDLILGSTINSMVHEYPQNYKPWWCNDAYNQNIRKYCYQLLIMLIAGIELQLGCLAHNCAF